MCHRSNNEFSSTMIKSSTVTVAQQKKNKAKRRDSTRAAVKDRAQEMVVKMKSADPSKLEELDFKRKMVDEQVKNGEVRRIEKKLAMLERHKDRMPDELYQERVNGLMAKLFEEESTPAETIAQEEPIEEEESNLKDPSEYGGDEEDCV